jgi:hypothetical protein
MLPDAVPDSFADRLLEQKRCLVAVTQRCGDRRTPAGVRPTKLGSIEFL